MDRTNELAPETETKKSARKPFAFKSWYVYLVMGGGFLLYYLLGRLDDFTEVTPDHDTTFATCCLFCCCLAVFIAVYLFRATRRSSFSIQLRTALPLMLIAGVVSFVFLNRICEIVEGYIDFPSSNTTTHLVVMSIASADHTSGKSPSWKVELTDRAVDLKIGPGDFNFMLAHRSPDDTGHDPDYIASHGYFCARVTIQRSGDAIRIMHAGSQKLPTGTVIVCPSPPQ